MEKRTFRETKAFKRHIRTDRAPSPIGPFAQAVEAGGFVFVQGLGGLDDTGRVVSPDVRDQTARSIENIQRILEAAGLGLEHVVKCTVYLTDMKDYDAMNQVYERYFKESLPTRTCVEVSALPAEEKMKIEVIAVRPAEPRRSEISLGEEG